MNLLMIRTRAIIPVFLVVALSGCYRSLVKCPVIPRVHEPPVPSLSNTQVLFATDRMRRPGDRLDFSGRRNLSQPHLVYGMKCEDPNQNPTPCDGNQMLEPADFFSRVTAEGKDVLLFVHGYRYSFDESLQIALRMRQRTGFDATPVAYSWPSQNHLLAYGKDYDLNEWTWEHLTEFLPQLIDALPAGRRLHIVAHSMGNRAVLETLARLHLPGERLGQLIMIAPDVDAQTFVELVRRAGSFQRETIYVSGHDLAIRVSWLLHSKAERAGDASRQYVVMDSLDTIDASLIASGIVGHAYAEESQLVFDDLGAILKQEPLSARGLTACTVTSVKKENEKNHTQLPCTIFRLPRGLPR